MKAFRIDLLPEQTAQLASELQRIVDAGLTHPGIVLPLASGMEGHLPFLAQEYVAAESLDIAMKHYAPAVPARVMPFLRAIAGALDAAAEAGILHGALHPRDVFVTTDEARATGFGIVQAIENIGFRAPTRRPYTAPERVAGDDWGREADVFSLAAIAHELLTGRRPAGPGDQDGSFSPDVPAEHRARVRDVLARALAEDPAARYASAGAFIDALQAASEGQAEPAAPASRGPRAAAAATAAPSLFDTGDADEDADSEDNDENEDDGVEGDEPDDDEAEDDDEADDDEAEDVEAEDVEEEDVEARHDDRGGDAEGDEDAVRVEALDDIEDEPVEPVEPEVRDVWPPPGFSLADPDVIAERETDAALGDFDLDLNHGAADAPYAPSLSYDTATEEDEDEPIEGDARAAVASRSDDDEPLLTAGPFAAPAATHASSHAAPPSAAWRTAPPMATTEPRAGGSGLRSLLLVLAGIVIGFVIAWFWLGSRDAATRTAPDAAAASPAAPATEEPVAPAQTQTPPSQAETPPAPVETPPAPAAPPAVASPGATTGRLVIRSTPTNAMVVIDGVWRGRTPFTAENVAFGRHTVRVVMDGYTPENRAVTLSAGNASREMTFELSRAASRRPDAAAPDAAASRAATGTLSVSSRPAGATVFVDGRNVGTTPLKLPGVAAGARRIRIELDGYRVFTSTVTVGRNTEARVAAPLQRQ